MDSNQIVDEHGPIQSPTCACCQQVLVPENDVTGVSEEIGICGDCQFLILEDIEYPVGDHYHRMTPRVRRTRHGSSENGENPFSQEFTYLINLVRQDQSSISSLVDQYADGSNAADVMQHSSSHTTPDQSRRWWQVYSDSENDALDSIGSMFGESESNFSFGPYRYSYGDIDAVSNRTYGGESDASMDGHSFLDTDIFVPLGEGSDDSDTDIDPMRAGVGHWDSSDEEEYISELIEAQSFHVSSGTGIGSSANWNEQLSSPEVEPGQIRRNRQFYAQSELLSLAGDSGDSHDQRSFEELIEQIAETTSPGCGAPPAAVCSVKNLPRLVISKEHLKHDSISCAICKDLLLVGVEVNQLPCLHLYHPSCILPWLSVRNSCPLCRYELPTDDRNYEERKQSSVNTALQHRVVDIDNSSRHGGRRRWLFVAAPIVGLVGIALMLWFGNPLCDRRVPGGQFTDARQLDTRIADASNRRVNRTRRWWSIV